MNKIELQQKHRSLAARLIKRMSQKADAMEKAGLLEQAKALRLKAQVMFDLKKHQAKKKTLEIHRLKHRVVRLGRGKALAYIVKTGRRMTDDKKEFEEFWRGKKKGYTSYWRQLRKGTSYLDRSKKHDLHLIEISFESESNSAPIANHEAIIQTLKGCFYEIQRMVLTPQQLEESSPLFLYEVRRGSVTYYFASELHQAIVFGTTITQQNIMNGQMDRLGKSLGFLREFGDGNYDLCNEKLMKVAAAQTPAELTVAIKELTKNGMTEVKVSKQPLIGDGKAAKGSLLKIGSITDTRA